MMLNLVVADIPAIYIPESELDNSMVRPRVATEILIERGHPSIYFEPLERRREALLKAVAGGGSTAEAVRDASMFLDLLPVTVPDPAIIVEEDGQIGLDWSVGDMALSLNLGKGGMIGYSAVFGPESAYGRTPLTTTEIPPRIAPFLASLAEQRQAG
jgi:hypothetical protein